MKVISESIKSSIYAAKQYWFEKMPNDIMFSINLLYQYRNSNNKILFLQEQLIEYPDAPDLLLLLSKEFRNIREYKKALELCHKILEVYPNLQDVKVSLKTTETLLLCESMPEGTETDNWFYNRMNEIEKEFNNGSL